MSIKILYGDIEILSKNKKIIKKNIVFREDATHYKNEEIIKIIESKIIGYVNQIKRYSEVKSSDEKRNKITGAYE